MATRVHPQSRRRPRAKPAARVPKRRPVPARVMRLARREADDAALEQRIAALTDQSLKFHAEQPERIERRLRELDAEWSIERVLQTHGAAAALAGALLGLVSGKRWLLLSALASGCVLQYATQGSSPPLRSLRRMGFRTNREIEQERYGLKALRGDFAMAPRGKNGAAHDAAGSVAAVLKAVRL